MKTYTIEVLTTFTKYIEVQAKNYDEAINNAWNLIEAGEADALNDADIDTSISHVYQRPADEYDTEEFENA